MHSAIYAGQVRHRRFQPRAHEFKYNLFMVYLDLDELDVVFGKSWLWSTKRPALAWFRRADHMGDKTESLKDSVKKYVRRTTGIEANGPIRMLTHLRYLGYCFNPVSFYYIYDETDTEVIAIVAEVSNTPWREQRCYVLTRSSYETRKGVKRYEFSKDFHVSPFMPMDIDYDWRFTEPGEMLSVHMNNEHKTGKMFDATLHMKREPITASNLRRILVKFPFMTGKVIGGIYWQAFRLWLKRTPFYTHPAKLKNSEVTRA